MFLMRNLLIISFYNLFTYIKTTTIYQCAKYQGMYNQCLNQWVDVYGNIFNDLWKCPVNSYCYTYPKKYNEDKMIGVCAYNYKKLYDGDSCSMDSECSSLNCIDSKCIGFPLGEYCRPNYFQCSNNLVCKKDEELLPYGEIKEVYKCNNLSKVNETCQNDNECDIKLICGNSSIYNIIDLMNYTNVSNITELNNTINFEDYILAKENDTKICIERASLENGMPTSDSMICKSGDSIDFELFPNYKEKICVSKIEIIKDCDENSTCIIKANFGNSTDIEIEQDCILSSKGNKVCPLNQKEKAWNNYLAKYQQYYEEMNVEEKRNNEIHFPVYKDTFNNFEVSQFYWYYKGWKNNIEADSCTKEYFFLKNKATILDYSLIYLLNIYLFLLL